MMPEDIFEPIEVITYFERGTLRPLRFRWKGTVYKISRVYSHWIVPRGNGREHHFSVSAGTPDSFELIFNTGDLNWQLARIATIE